MFNIDTGTGNDIIAAGQLLANDAAAEHRTFNGGEGHDVIQGSQGNDFINGGAGEDWINAGAGDDIIVFDEQDTINAGDGFDALLVTDNAIILNDHSGLGAKIGFEAIIGEEGTGQVITTQVTDGLVIALGGDANDHISFTGNQDFILTATSLAQEADAMLSLNGIDTSGLRAYYALISESTVWSDVALV